MHIIEKIFVPVENGLPHIYFGKVFWIAVVYTNSIGPFFFPGLDINI